MANKEKTKRLVLLSLLVAIEAMLVVTNLGFILIPPVSITILHVPVILGAILMGPSGGAILGGSFGVLSMLNATFRGVSPVDLAFSPFTSGRPLASILMCIGARVVFGFLAGVLFKYISKLDKTKLVASIITAAVSTLAHTLLVMCCLWFLFPNLSISFKAVIETIMALNFLIEVIVAVFFSIAFAKVLPTLLSKK